MRGGDYSWRSYVKRLYALMEKLRAGPPLVVCYETPDGRVTGFELPETEIEIYSQAIVKLEETGIISRGRYAPGGYCFHYMCAAEREQEVMRFEKKETDAAPHYHDRSRPGTHFQDPGKIGLDVDGFCSVLALKTGECYIELRCTPLEARARYNCLWREERKRLGWA